MRTLVFILATIPTFAFAGQDLIPEAGWVSSMSATALTCPKLGMDCQKDLATIRTKLETAGFLVLRTTKCAPKREDTYSATCPGGDVAAEVATVYFAK